MIAAGLLPVFSKVVLSYNAHMQTEATRLLTSLATGCQSSKTAIIVAGILPDLVVMLQSPCACVCQEVVACMATLAEG